MSLSATLRHVLRLVRDDDLPVFFEHQRDAPASEIAAVAMRDRASFDGHWARARADPVIVLRTIEVDGAVAGNVLSFLLDGRRVVGYWIGREFWGRGVASAALAQFLREVEERPLHAFVAAHNVGSRRVLEKNAFVMADPQPEPHPGDIEEFLLVLG